jgi:hypothetical protein
MRTIATPEEDRLRLEEVQKIHDIRLQLRDELSLMTMEEFNQHVEDLLAERGMHLCWNREGMGRVAEPLPALASGK